MIDRRVFIGALAGGLSTAPLAAEAQQAGRVWRIGLLDYASPDPARLAWWRAFQDRLRELGYAEGQNVVFQPRWGNGQVSRLQGLVTELVATKIDILVTAGSPAAVAAKQVTSSIPIVTASGPDPVELGLVASLGRPGGNVTGVTSISRELSAKRLELLKELIPQGVPSGRPLGSYQSRVGVRCTGHRGRGSITRNRSAKCRRAPRSQRLRDRIRGHEARRRRGGHRGVQRGFFASRQRIAVLALTHRLPSAVGRKEDAKAGGLISYGVDNTDLFRRAAVFVDKILKGAKPADLPIEQPTKFELVINLKTAKTLGLTIPQSLLLRADEVIE